MDATLYYVHDPMCSWCWAFRPVWGEVRAQLPPTVAVRPVLGGLAPDTEEPMPGPLRERIQATWRRIAQEVPGIELNFAFWEICRPRRSTYPACRAVLCAREQEASAEEAMVLAIQRAYYLQARNPSEVENLNALAGEIGLDTRRFARDLGSARTRRLLEEEIRFAGRIGARSFPSLFLDLGGGPRSVPVDYREAGAVLRWVESLIDLRVRDS